MENSPLHEAIARSNLYGLLARFFRQEVDAELLAELRRPETAEALRDVGLQVAETLPESDDAALLEDLARAYSYSFLLTVNPHGSMQRGEGQLWGNTTVAASEFMAEVGLQIVGEHSLLPDHIATQLNVMQVLAGTEGEALAEGNEELAQTSRSLQKRYMKEHLGTWGIEFFGAAERLANHEFYRQIARLGSRFLYSEREGMGL